MSDFKLSRKNEPDLTYTWEAGDKDLLILYLHGWTAHRKSKKADTILETAKRNRCHYVSIDYTGHGESGGTLADFTVGRGLKDILDILSTLPKIPMIIVGNSIGGWIGFLLAEKLKHRVLGVLALAPAVDITQDIWNELLPPIAKEALNHGDIIGPSPDTQGFCLTQDLFKNGIELSMLDRGIEYTGPVRIVWGDRDNRVKLDKIIRIKNALKSENVTLTLLKGSDHHLSENRDLKMIESHLTDLIQEVIIK